MDDDLANASVAYGRKLFLSNLIMEYKNSSPISKDTNPDTCDGIDGDKVNKHEENLKPELDCAVEEVDNKIDSILRLWISQWIQPHRLHCTKSKLALLSHERTLIASQKLVISKVRKTIV